MKKLFYSLAVAATTVFAACDPLAEIQEGVEQLPAEAIVESYTFTADDYKYFGNDVEYFSESLDPAKNIPLFLAVKARNAGPKSIMTITYDMMFDALERGEETVYTVQEAEYPGSYPNFSSSSDITNFTASKYPNAVKGDVIRLTYDYYAGYVSTRTSDVIFDGEIWRIVSELEDEDYDFMGQRYSNFENHETAADRIVIWANENFLFDNEEGKKMVIGYTYTYKDQDDNRQYDDHVVELEYNEGAWIVPGVKTITEQFEFNGTEWKVIRAKFYTLSTDDYVTIAAFDPANEDFETISRYSNFGYYLNKEGTYKGEEVDNVLHMAMIDFMNLKFADEKEGQLFIVTYDYYNSGSTTPTKIKMVKTADSWEVAE